MIKTKDADLTSRQTVFYFLIILVGLFLRWYHIDQRPFHHDESLHAVYGAYNYFSPEHNFYKYSALLHGPLLYDLLPYFYEMLGATDFAARSLITLIGSLFLLVPLLFRHKLNSKTLIYLTTILAVSPLLVYYSRFLREDFLVLSTMMGMLYAVVTDKERIKGPLFLCSLSLHYCVKENVFITMALLLGFLAYDAFINLFLKQEKEISKLWKFLKGHWLSTLIGFASAVFIFCYIYSARFRYSKGIIDGLYRDSLLYWLNQHNVERIKGPFAFQFLMISWYDFYFILLMIFFFFHSFYKMKSQLKWYSLGSIVMSFVMYFLCNQHMLETNSIFLFFKLKIPFDLWWLILLVPHSIIITTHHMLSKQKDLAWFSYLFYASFFTYSYVGEKVPWLALYPLVFGLIYFAVYFDHYFTNRNNEIVNLGLIFIGLFTLRICLITNFNRGGDETELISQVHTTKEFHSVMKKIRDRMVSPTKLNSKALITGDAVWPATWYLFNEPDYHYYDQGVAKDEYPFVIENYMSAVNLDKSHRKITLKLRGWWVPEYNDLNIKNYLNYVITHRPWSPVGHSFVDFYLKKDFN
ncbi:MAG: flippase activity-associated protein Agl23 [Bacteriovoracaceae bacterium]